MDGWMGGWVGGWMEERVEIFRLMMRHLQRERKRQHESAVLCDLFICQLIKASSLQSLLGRGTVNIKICKLHCIPSRTDILGNLKINSRVHET